MAIRNSPEKRADCPDQEGRPGEAVITWSISRCRQPRVSDVCPDIVAGNTLAPGAACLPLTLSGGHRAIWVQRGSGLDGGTRGQ